MVRTAAACRAHTLSLALVVLIAVALLAPVPAPTTLPGGWSPPHLDKVGHLLLFLAGAFAWRRSLVQMGARRPALVCFVLAVAFGALLEVAQGLTATRQPELADLVADAVGTLLAFSFRG